MGTGAAEGVPAIFCNCSLCVRAREQKGKNIRTRSQTLIDGQLLIDFPPDSYMHYLHNDFPLPDITSLLVTHSHTDHFYATDLTMRTEPLAHQFAGIMNIYGNQTVEESFYKHMPDTFNVVSNYRYHRISFFVPFTMGSYEITPLPANHDKTEDCVNYLISDGEKQVLYAHDTGFFHSEVWSFLEGKPLDLISLDCTSGAESEGTNHMGIPDCEQVKKRLEELGCTNDQTQFVLSHFSHNCGLNHEELLEIATPLGFTIAFDGFEITI